MGTGKTRVGSELARALALHFIDTDKVIGKVCGMSIEQLFRQRGEGYFRACESEVVGRVVRLENAVVSLGGGAFLCPKNREHLLQRGPVVVLWASPETIYARTRNSDRPLLNHPRPLEEIERLLAERHESYTAGTLHVSSENRSSEEVVEEIIEKLWRWREAQDG